MPKAYYEFKDKTSSKFWEIDTKGKTVTVRFGKIGTDGQTTAKTFGAPRDATAHAAKVTAEKVKKGYKQATAGQRQSGRGRSPSASIATDAEWDWSNTPVAYLVRPKGKAREFARLSVEGEDPSTVRIERGSLKQTDLIAYALPSSTDEQEVPSPFAREHADKALAELQREGFTTLHIRRYTLTLTGRGAEGGSGSLSEGQFRQLCGLRAKKLTRQEQRELDTLTGDWSAYSWQCDDYGGVCVEGGSIHVDNESGTTWESRLPLKSLVSQGMPLRHVDYPVPTTAVSECGYSRMLLQEGSWHLGELLLETAFEPSRFKIEGHWAVVDDALEESLVVDAVRYGDWIGSFNSSSADSTYSNYPPDLLAYQKIVMEKRTKTSRQVYLACMTASEPPKVVEQSGSAGTRLKARTTSMTTASEALEYLERAVAKYAEDGYRSK